MVSRTEPIRIAFYWSRECRQWTGENRALKNFQSMSSTIDLPMPIIEWSNYIVIGLLSLDRSCTSQWPPALGGGITSTAPDHATCDLCSKRPHQTTPRVVIACRPRPGHKITPSTTLCVTCVVKGRTRPRRV